jgi:hypothetical protein
VARSGSDPDRSRPDPRSVATREAPGSLGQPALRVESGLSPYRSAANPGAPDRTHAHALSEQRARRRWGLASAALSLTAFAAIPFALAESHFTATLAGMIGLGFASLASVSLRAYARERGASVAVFDQGMLVAMGGVQRSIPWESITRVHAEYAAANDGSLRVVAVTRVHTADGAVLAIPRAVADPAALAATILERTTAHLEQSARRALAHGDVVRFGAVTATAQGLIAGAHLWTWEALPSLAVEGPFLHVFAQHDPMPPSTLLIEEQIDNLHVLLALLRPGNRPIDAPSPHEDASTGVRVEALDEDAAREPLAAQSPSPEAAVAPHASTAAPEAPPARHAPASRDTPMRDEPDASPSPAHEVTDRPTTRA